jgi:hypothetical protein
MLNLTVAGSMDKQEPVADVEQKIVLAESPREQVITIFLEHSFQTNVFFNLLTNHVNCF